MFHLQSCNKKLVERVNVAMGVRINFSMGGCSVNILLIFFRLLTLQCEEAACLRTYALG